MKLTVKRPVDIDVCTIRVEVAVRYDDEDIPYDFPLRAGSLWVAHVDIATGVIRDWPAGRSGKCYMKVCDQGSYYLYDAAGGCVAPIEQDYVPDCIPGEYGDYIDFEIGPDGKVLNWSKHCTPGRVAKSFFRDG